MATRVIKRYVNHFGLDLKNSDLVRPDQFASDMTNAQYDKDGSLEKRRGYQAVAESEGGYGLVRYNRLDPDTAAREEILLSVSNKLHKLTESNFNIAYSGSGSIATASLYFDPDTDAYRLVLMVDGSTVLDSDLGQGFDEAAPKTVATLKTEVDGVADFAATITGDDAAPAAFLTITREFDLIGGSLDMTVRQWVDVDTSTSATTPFAGSETNKNDDDFENVSFSQVNNVMYISNGYDYLQKYDGNRVYRAGLPKPDDIVSIADIGAGSVPDGTYLYAITYEQQDAAGNIIESDISAQTSYTVSGGPKDQNITYENLNSLNDDADGNTMSGFNDAGAIVAGAQVTVNTITVDDGSAGAHTMAVGDQAYFYDSVTGDFVVREITAVTATTITVDGAAVTVADNAVISNNLRVNIWRSAAGGTFLYLLATEPNNAFVATSVRTDNVPDTSGNLQFIDPSPQNHGLPPKGRYLATYDNQLGIAGNLEDPHTLYFSSIDSPEYFPLGNSLLVQANINEKITGIAQNNDVFAVFKERSIHIVTGDLNFLNFRVEAVTKDIGCVSHATIQEVRGSLYFLSDRGVYSMVRGQLPVERSVAIEPVFRQNDIPVADRFTAKRAVAINHRDDQQYILFLPTEATTGSEKRPDESKTVLYVEDYFREAWLKWDNINMMAGAAIYKDELYFSERRLSSFTSTVDHVLYKQMNLADAWDYQDHANPVEFSYSTNWYDEDEASTFKKFLWIKFFIKDKTDNNNFSMDLSSEANFVPGLIKTIHSFDDSGTGGYGVSAYGTTAYGDVEEPVLRVKLKSGKVKSMRFILENSMDQQNVSLFGWEYEVANSYVSRLKE